MSVREFASICKVIPGQELVNAVDLVICNTTENISEPRLGIDAVELGGFNTLAAQAEKTLAADPFWPNWPEAAYMSGTKNKNRSGSRVTDENVQ